MNRKATLVLIATIVLGAVSPTQAQDRELTATFDLTYMSKLMDKGGEYYGQRGGLLECLDVDLWGTGFGVAVGHREAVGSGYVNKERFDYKVYYGNSLFEDRAYKTDYKVNWIYHHHPDQARNMGNTQEWEFAFAWPDTVPGGLVPTYTACYEYPAGRSYANRKAAGWWHLFGLGYSLNVDGLPNPLNLSANLAYRDGLGGADHDWSHAAVGVSTEFDLAENLTFVPGLYHQISMDDSVSKNDVTYTTLSVAYKF